MNEARAIIEKKIQGWRAATEQLAARRRRLEDDLVQIDGLTQQHIGAIQGAQELLSLLPAETEPQPEPQPEPQAVVTPGNNPLADVPAVEQPAAEMVATIPPALNGNGAEG